MEVQADQAVRAAYSDRAQEYAALLGTMSASDPADREYISEWAEGRRGPIVDVGCGPGHWTSFLSELGSEVEGVDLVPAFVELARSRFPSARYRVAGFDDLGLADRSVAGVLAWYSLIHLEPARLPAVLDELTRCLRADGTLVVGFFVGERIEPFAHAVTTAYSWPVDELARHLEIAGLRVVDARTRPNPDRPDRAHGVLLAERARGR